MLFLIDAQLPPALAVALRSVGRMGVHVTDLGLETARDREIWEKAVERSAILVTKDRDFALRRSAISIGPTILWIRTGNIDNQTLISRLLRALPTLESAIKDGKSVIHFHG